MQCSVCERCDYEIGEVYGNSGWALQEFLRIWNELESTGDEIGWHFHLLIWDDSYKIWRQEDEDENWIKPNIRDSYESFKKTFKRPPFSLRMGWNFSNNITMREMSRMGIKIDFSATPGYSAPFLKKKTIYTDYSNWSSTPFFPYYPSANDYRLPAGDKERSLSILEVPLMSYPSFLFSLMNIVTLSIKNKIIPTQIPRSFCPTISLNPILFKGVIKELIKRLHSPIPKNLVFATYFHPDEILLSLQSRRKFQNSYKCFLSNLTKLTDLLNKKGVPFEFITAKELYIKITNEPEAFMYG